MSTMPFPAASPNAEGNAVQRAARPGDRLGGALNAAFDVASPMPDEWRAVLALIDKHPTPR